MAPNSNTLRAGGYTASPCYTPVMPELREVPDEAPPFLGTWRRVYVAILIYLCFVIAAFYLFTRAYR